LRVVFLYVGQGASVLLLSADGAGSYKTMLIDINLDAEREGIDVPRLVADLVKEADGHLGCFVNTHPHTDHLKGVKELDDTVPIDEAWHCGYEPGGEHNDVYQDLCSAIEGVEERGGAVVEIRGSRETKAWGDATYYTLAPADHVKEAIEQEPEETRDRRIHEYCAVLRFGVGDTWVLITGDADRDAWKNHITDYHGNDDDNRIASAVMAGPHHGSRTFFRYDESEDPYEDAIEQIGPAYVVIMAPRREESPHGHPHQDALDLYEQHTGGSDHVLHTGENRECFIVDVYPDGKYGITSDDGRLAEEYRLAESDSDAGGDGSESTEERLIPCLSTPDRAPMGSDNAR
jgi:competence protein ComEC